MACQPVFQRADAELDHAAARCCVVLRIRPWGAKIAAYVTAVLLIASIVCSSSAAAEPLKLNFVPQNAVFAFVIQPQRLYKTPELELLPWEMLSAYSFQATGIEPADVRLCVGFMGLEGFTNGEPGMGVVLDLAKPVVRAEVFQRLGLRDKAIEHGDHVYYRYLSGQNQSITVAFPDDRTLLIASNANYMVKMLDAKPGEMGIHRLLRKVDLERDAALALDFEKLAPLIVLGLQAFPDIPPVFEEFLQLPELLTSVEASIKIGPEVDLQITLGARDATGAADLNKLAERAKTLTQDFVEREIVPGVQGAGQGAIGDAFANYARRATKLTLDRIKIAQQEKELAIHVRVPVNSIVNGAAMGMMFAGMASQSTPNQAMPMARQSAARAQSVNNLKQIGLALHTYHDAYNRFPAQARLDPDAKPLLSWRVAALAYIDAELYREFHLDEPWDSEHNKTLIERMPAIYRAPGQTGEKGKTVYLAADGKQCVFEEDGKPIGLRSIVDGSSNTILVVEADDDRAVIWTKPDDLKYNPEKPLKGLGKMQKDHFLVLMADGSAQKAPNDINQDKLRALFTRDGRENVGLKD